MNYLANPIVDDVSVKMGASPQRYYNVAIEQDPVKVGRKQN